jgi:hypothetical protein
VVKSQKGSLQVPLVIGVAIATITALSILGLMRHWRSITELQLRLDECAGRTGIELKSRLESLEKANTRIKAIRAAIAATSALPYGQAAKPPLEAALLVEVSRQEIQLSLWRAKMAAWLLRRGCDARNDLVLPLPALPWLRDPPDEIGPAPLRWTGKAAQTFTVRLGHPPRYSAAEVTKTNEGRWMAKWKNPFSLL